MRVLALILFIFTVSFSCTQTKEENHNSFIEPQEKFKTLDFYHFAIQDSEEVKMRYYTYFDNGILHAINYNPVQDSIVILSEENKVIAKTHLKLSNDSTELILGRDIFYLQDKRQFVGITEDSKSIVFITMDGNLIKHLPFKDGLENFEYKDEVATVSLYHTPYYPFYDGQNIYITLLGSWKFRGVESGSDAYYNEFIKYPAFAKLDATTYSMVLSGIKHTTTSLANRQQRYIYTHPYLAFNQEKNNIAVSFVAEKNLYIYKNGKLDKKVDASSKFIEEKDIYPLKDSSPAKLSRYGIEVASYMGIYYDKYRKLYYRIARHKQSYESEDGLTVRRHEDKPFSLIVLDEDFEKVAEVKLDQNLYTIYFHITEEGLWFEQRKKDKSVQKTTYQLFTINQNH